MYEALSVWRLRDVQVEVVWVWYFGMLLVVGQWIEWELERGCAENEGRDAEIG